MPWLCDDVLVWIGYPPDRQGEVYWFSPEGLTRLTDDDRLDSAPMTDGRYIVWRSLNRSGREPMLHIYDANTRTRRDLALQDFPMFDLDRGWVSSDGRDRVGRFDCEISIANRDTGRVTQLTNDTINQEPPRVDRDYVVWAAEVSGRPDREIFLYEIPTGVLRQLTRNDVDDWLPVMGDGRVAWMITQGRTEVYTRIYVYDIATEIASQAVDVGPELFSKLDDLEISRGRIALRIHTTAGHDLHQWEIACAVPMPFSDVPLGPTGNPYRQAIRGTQLRGLVSGYEVPRYEFRPDNPVLRAQCAKILCGAFELWVDESMSSPFTDSGEDDPPSLYPHEYVAAAAAHGITRGLTPSRFGPYEPVTRAQAATMPVQAAMARSDVLRVPPRGRTGRMAGFSESSRGENMRIAEYG